jgi:OmpA-OmpF porin, OOP family
MSNRYLLGAGVALAMALGGVQAHAQFMGQSFFGPYPPGAFYLGPEGGWTQLMSQTNTFTATRPNGTTAQIKRNSTFNSGFNAGVRAGYMWGPWRFEEEYSYLYNGLQSFAGAGNAIVKGNDHANAIMTNVLYDFTFGWPITPHIGGGIGAVNVDTGVTSVGNRVPANIASLGFSSISLNGNSWQFGYQGIAGLRYLINPALALDLDYRYLATSNLNFTNKNVGIDGHCCGAVSVRSGYNTQNVVASLTMMFGAPPPAAPPPAPPAPPPPPTHQVYLVFFDWDKYNITPEGMQILEAAAAHYRAGGAVQIQVTGYTDLTGSPGYNQRLSERRAGAVAAVLERLGVPRNEMIVAGRGMNDPRVPTPLGVREPQNRRVEIVFP